MEAQNHPQLQGFVHETIKIIRFRDNVSFVEAHHHSQLQDFVHEFIGEVQ